MKPPFILTLLFSLFSNAAATGMVAKTFTTNYFCMENNCVNPIFPAFRLLGSDVLDEQATRKWRCVKDLSGVGAGETASRYSELCGVLLDEYSFAVPDEPNKKETLEQRMRRE